jgi:SAM-dependent MidA family methyltransferase
MIQQRILTLLKQTGYLTLDKFLAEVISYYYTNNHVFGKDGDFITAPEISQLFGDIIGFWCVHHLLNAPGGFCLLELGAGRGTLMKDILHIIKKFPKAYANLHEIHIIEISPSLQKIQQRNLMKFNDLKIIWHKDLSDFSTEENILCIANEFFDALPVKQFIRTNNGLNEIVVVMEDNEFTLVQKPVLGKGFDIPSQLTVGDIWEISPVGSVIADKLANYLQASAYSAALLIDYGYIELPRNATLQAIKNHNPCGILEHLGKADISALVNFTDLASRFTSKGLNCSISYQGEFLLAHGIEQRAQTVIKANADADAINSQLNRLCNPKQMGTLFKVLEVNKPSKLK